MPSSQSDTARIDALLRSFLRARIWLVVLVLMVRSCADQRRYEERYRGAQRGGLGQRQVHEDHAALDHVQPHVAMQRRDQQTGREGNH